MSLGISDKINAGAPGVSVILCCYNSVGRLQPTLRNLAFQRVPQDVNWEIILVDNASTDGTAKFGEKTWKEESTDHDRLSIIVEEKPGQMFARISGVEHARYDTIVFCDDDNLLGPDYVAVAFEALKTNPNAGAAGGNIYPVTGPKGFPDWFEEWKDKYATGVPANQSGVITQRGFVLGAGLITRKWLFLAALSKHYPSLLKGREGNKLSTGDDFEYCKRIILWGFELYYDKRLVLEHFIPEERLTIAYRDRLQEGISQAGLILDEYDQAIKTLKRINKKSPFRLLALTPLRMSLILIGLSKRKMADERSIFFYAMPPFLQWNNTRKAIKQIFNGNPLLSN